MVITWMALRRPDKTGHFQTLGQKALKTDDGALGANQLTTKARRHEGGREEVPLRGECLECPVGGTMEIDASPVGTGG